MKFHEPGVVDTIISLYTRSQCPVNIPSQLGEKTTNQLYKQGYTVLFECYSLVRLVVSPQQEISILESSREKNTTLIKIAEEVY